jgi:adenine phosphoribosyltransferase
VTETLAERLKRHVTEIPDFPKPGLRYRDITPILRDPAVFKETVDALAERIKGREIDLIVGIESRGYIFSAPLAYRLGKGFLPIQWSDRLPEDKGTAYRLEYGFNAIDVHEDALKDRKGLIVDDLLATGATLEAVVGLVREAGGQPVAAAVVVEVPSLEGRDRLPGLEVISLCQL